MNVLNFSGSDSVSRMRFGSRSISSSSTASVGMASTGITCLLHREAECLRVEHESVLRLRPGCRSRRMLTPGIGEDRQVPGIAGPAAFTGDLIDQAGGLRLGSGV